MASRKLTFDASKPSARNLGASPAARNMLAATSQQHPFLSPTRTLATPTRPSQRATLARIQQSRRDMLALATPTHSTPGSHSTGLTRRNPLQAITEREHQRNNQQQQQQHADNDSQNHKMAQSHEHAVSAAPAHSMLTPEQQRQQKARVAEWIYAYRRAFPSFVFYFEGIDENTVRRLSVPVRSLGAKVETFFSAQTVTHVIVESASVASDENATGSSHVVSLAKRFHLKIWDLDKLENRVLVFLLPGYNVSSAQSPSVLSAKRKLNEAFSAEKMYAMRHKTFEGNSVAHCVDFYYFKYFYVLVEDAMHLNRPAIVEDYRPPEPGRDPPWPKLYMVPAGRCPFVQYEDPTTSSKYSDSEGEENKENATPEPEATLPTAQLLSKTPASRLQTPRRKAWTPSAARATAESAQGAGRPFATAQAHHTRNAADADGEGFVTPTRPSRTHGSLFGSLGAASKDADGGSRHLDASAIIDSNASGMAQSRGVTSTSTAFHLSTADPTLQQNLLQNLNGGRVTQLSRLEQPVASPRVAGRARGTRGKGRAPPTPRTKKPRVPARRPMVARPGYCENCRVKYEDMMEHVKTPQHRRFASNERNWIELDALLERVRRPLRKPHSATEGALSHALYALSSDDTGDAVPASGSSALPHHMRHGAAAGTISAPPSLAGNWGSNPFTAHASGNGLTSTQMLASGRLSTEAFEGAAGASGAAGNMNGARHAEYVIDLTFSNTNTNSSCPSPKQPAEHGSGVYESSMHPPAAAASAAASTSNAAARPATAPLTPTQHMGNSSNATPLASSLETPKFPSGAMKTAYDEGATLFGEGRDCQSRHGSHLDGQYGLQTPTRAIYQHSLGDMAAAAKELAGSGCASVSDAGAAAEHNQLSQESIGGSTLIQPSRALSKFSINDDGSGDGGAEGLDCSVKAGSVEHFGHALNEEAEATG